MLDVGCGPRSWLRDIETAAFGVDISPDFTRAFHRAGGRAVLASAIALPFRDGCFQSVWSFGLLHHLPEHEARCAIREMRRVTRAGGRTVIFDAVLPNSAWRRPLAALLRRLDRGRWMRRQNSLEALLAASALNAKESWMCERMTYAHTGLEGLWCRVESSQDSL